MHSLLRLVIPFAVYCPTIGEDPQNTPSIVVQSPVFCLQNGSSVSVTFSLHKHYLPNSMTIGTLYIPNASPHRDDALQGDDDQHLI